MPDPELPGHFQRRLPVGAECLPGQAGAHFRVWAPQRKTVHVLLNDTTTFPLRPETDGYFSAPVAGARPGDLYRFRIENQEPLLPDPASRFQPEGPHGPSEIIDSAAFPWTDQSWSGVGPQNQVLYEMHVGTFTPEGTFSAAQRELPHLADLGVTCLEVMPVADFPGRFGWGYDGVNLFAPARLYGRPDDFRRFIDRAHALGIGVILDVVYNHLGPDGNYLRHFAEDYFSRHRDTAWGKAINFDGENCGPVREYYLANVRYWLEEFHLDGFRFDATQCICDDSPEHILAEIARTARTVAGRRKVFLVNENEPQQTHLVRPRQRGGFGLDASWNDDFHRSAMVALTGRREAYYTDHRGDPQEFISAVKYGHLFQGQRSAWQNRRRGTPALDLPPTAFVNFIQNHDQVANSARGCRVHQLTSPALYRATTALLLLAPQTPMLFQGQEFAASGNFHYFADHRPELNELIRTGRAKELAEFPSIATAEIQSLLLDPADERTFRRSKIDHNQRSQPGHAEVYALHKDLLRLRKQDGVFRRVHQRGEIDGAVLSPQALLLRYFARPEDPDFNGDRLVLINLGPDLALDPAPEPLLAPPPDARWCVLLSTEHPAYGGTGTPPPETEQAAWRLPAHCALVLRPLLTQ